MGTPPSTTKRSSRAPIVWVSLIASMTGVGGVLHLLAPGQSSATSSPPAAAALIEETASPLDRAEATRWDAIVIHDSGTPMGSAQTLAARDTARGIRGLGMHFVIGNGQGAGDGEIQVGYRWDDQLPGAHTVGTDADFYNRRGIGICLIGDGERRPFTDAQLASLAALVRELRDRCGISGESVVLQREIGPTASPGRLFPASRFRAQVASDRP
ncbi:MAG: peptidoglycan recognition family protein [Planctomycetota bacterium]